MAVAHAWKGYESNSPNHVTHPIPISVRASVHTQAVMLNVKLTFVGVWVKMPDVRVVAEMSKTNFQNTMCNNSNKK